MSHSRLGAAAQSEPDGYTLLIGGLSNMAFNSALYSKLSYDPQRDFVPVAVVYKFGYVMVGRKDMTQTRLQDIVAAAKANPGSIRQLDKTDPRDRHQARLKRGQRPVYFTRSINSIAPAGARTLPSWITYAKTSRGAFFGFAASTRGRSSGSPPPAQS